jgi:RNAse (barnase) inhibitor barstar
MEEHIKQIYRERFREVRDNNRDLAILSHGGISFYRKTSVLEYDIDLLKKKNYKVIEFEGEFITNRQELHFDLKQKLEFPDYYGMNFDALVDCLIDYEVDENGVLIVFRNLNNLDSESIQILLDVFTGKIRRALTFRKHLILMVQVNDVKFKIEPVGAINFWFWNDYEWFEDDRY